MAEGHKSLNKVSGQMVQLWEELNTYMHAKTRLQITEDY